MLPDELLIVVLRLAEEVFSQALQAVRLQLVALADFSQEVVDGFAGHPQARLGLVPLRTGFVTLPCHLTECLSELPVETYGFQVQQSRWAKGLTQVAIKLLPTILRSDAPRKVKIEAFFHLTPNISYPLMIVVSALMLPVMIVRFYMGWFQMLTIDLPLIIASFWSISAFYVVAHRELFPKTWKRAFLFLPAL